MAAQQKKGGPQRPSRMAFSGVIVGTLEATKEGLTFRAKNAKLRPTRPIAWANLELIQKSGLGG